MEPRKLSTEEGETPVKALFFVYNGDLLEHARLSGTFLSPLEEQLTIGVAALVAGDGTAVTCAHVVLLRNCPPGKRLWLIHFETRIAVEATVLEEGWSGPDLQDFREVFAAGGSINPAYLTPKQSDRDLAFLSIDFASARKQLDGPAEADSHAELLDAVRVLPLGVPGYKPGSKALLTAWRAHWTNREGNDISAYKVGTAQAEFEITDRALGDTLQVKSDTLAPGFSGSPLWDPERRVAVAVVREGIRAVLQERVLATDARALTRHSSVRIGCDVHAQRAIDALARMSLLRHSARHRNAVGVEGARNWVEPELQALRYDTQEGSLRVSAEQEPLPALEMISDPIRAARHLLILGDAGTGKSRLLEEVASRSAQAQAGLPAGVPLFLAAKELMGTGAGLAERVDHAFARSGLVDKLAIPLSDLLRINGVQLLLFIDGIDELPKGARVQLIDEIVRAVRLGSDLPLKRLVIATRPIDEIEHPDLLSSFASLELLPFRAYHLEAFVNSRFTHPEERSRFTQALKEHRLFESEGNPLQLSLAAVVFRENRELPDNPVQLVREFVEIELIRMQDESEEARKEPRRREPLAKEELFRHSREILARVALASMQENGNLPSDGVVRAITSLGGETPLWLADETHLQLFVDKELAQRAGLFRTDGTVVEWLHQTIMEHCAAEAVVTLADTDKNLRDWTFNQIWDTGRYGFVLSLLGLLDLAGRRAAVEALIRCIVRNSTVRPRAIIIPLRFLATGAMLSEGLTLEIVRRFVRALLADQINETCLELMKTLELASDVTEARRLCRDPRMRPLILAAIEERLGVRRMKRPMRRRTSDRSAPSPDPTVPISHRENEILQRFELRDDIKLPLRVRGEAGPDSASWSSALQAPASPGAEVGTCGVAYLLASLQGGPLAPWAAMPSREFAESLVEFTRQATPGMPPEQVVALYITFILDRIASTSSDQGVEPS